MLQERIIEVEETIRKITGVQITKSFEKNDAVIKGTIAVLVVGLSKELEFDVLIYPQYPFKSHEAETIKFFNEELLEYNHVMGDGSICIHTAHSPVLSQKLEYDIESLKAWIKKYYIDRDIDTHYEHIIVPQKPFKNSHFAYFFNEVAFQFKKNQYGFVDYSQISHGSFYAEKITSSVIQNFKDKDGRPLVDVKWNVKLKAMAPSIGLFIFLEDAPVKNKRFAVGKWGELNPFLNQEFLSFLHSVEKKYGKNKNRHLPLFVGYKISGNEIHWQTIMLEISQLPIYGLKESQKFITAINDEIKIDWAITKNCSYKYFFGRGKLDDSITNSKILIIGIGAIGSITAKTLVRSGCTKIDLLDFDVKEPENICRSEYSFITGINNKTIDLLNDLFSVSPFLESNISGYDFSEGFNFYLKAFCKDETRKKEIESYLNQYDLIIDCSADNDFLFILSQLNLSARMINLSISNHAKQLVCAVEKNRYDFVMNQYQNVLSFEVKDLYNPTGCWSPTFKAAYNDINVLVQYAMKHINLKYPLHEGLLKNFVLETDTDNNFNIKLKEF